MRIVTGIFLVLIFSFGLVNVIADEAGNNSENDSNQSEKWGERCSAVERRVEGRIKMYEENRDPHFARFEKFAERISMFADNAEDKGFNVTKVREDINILDEKIAKLENDYDAFIEKLKETRNFTCGHSEGRFKEALNESRAQLRVVREDVNDIKKFFREVIKSDLNDLRKESNRGRVNEIKERINERVEEERGEIRSNLENRTEKIKMMREELREETLKARNITIDARVKVK